MPPDRHVVRRAALHLLRGRQRIAQPPLEGMRIEDRRLPGRPIGVGHDLRALLDGVRRREPDAVRCSSVSSAPPSRSVHTSRSVPQMVMARRAMARHELRQLRLEHGALAHGRCRAALRLGGGECQQVVERAACDAQHHAAERGRIHMRARKLEHRAPRRADPTSPRDRRSARPPRTGRRTRSCRCRCRAGPSPATRRGSWSRPEGRARCARAAVRPARRRGWPSRSNTLQCAPIQVALRMPLANVHVPVTR